MNTRLGKSFGLAFVVAVGILALMFALGTFNAQKAGAQTVTDSTAVSVTFNTVESGPAGASGLITVTMGLDGHTAKGYGDSFIIDLPDFGLPSSIATTTVRIRAASLGAQPDFVSVLGSKITVGIGDMDGDENITTPPIPAPSDEVPTEILFLQSAGITLPTKAGTYAVTVDALRGVEEVIDPIAEPPTTEVKVGTAGITVSRSLSVDPKKGTSGTAITVTGKALTNGTGSLHTKAWIDGDGDGVLSVPDSNQDGVADTIVKRTAPAESYGIDIDGDGTIDSLYVQSVPVATRAEHLPLSVNTMATADAEDGVDVTAVILGYYVIQTADVDGEQGKPVLYRPAATIIENTAAPEAIGERADKYDRQSAEGGLVRRAVTISDGASSTEIDAKDLKAGHETGFNRLRVMDAGGKSAYAVFQVTGAMTLSPESANKGGIVKISLSNWIDSAPTSVTIAGVVVKFATSSGSTDANATADNEQPVPGPMEADVSDRSHEFWIKVTPKTSSQSIGLGTKTLALLAGSETLASTDIAISATSLGITPATAVAGQQVTVSGGGFSNSTNVSSVKVQGKSWTVPSGLQTTSTGHVTINFPVPDGVAEGDRIVEVIDADGKVGEATLIVPTPAITIDPATSKRGTTVRVSGSGFPAEQSIMVDYDSGKGAEVARSDTTGTWTADLTIPSDATIGGEAKIVGSYTHGTGDAAVVYTAVQTHSVPAQDITLSATQAPSGASLMVSGSGFPAYQSVQVKFGDHTPRGLGVNTDGNGDFPATSVLVPGLDTGIVLVGVTVDQTTSTKELEIVATPVSTTMTSEEAFADLVAADNLIVVWYFDNDTKGWSFYDPRPEVAAAVDLTMVNTGDNVWIQITADQMFQGKMRTAGWNLVTLN